MNVSVNTVFSFDINGEITPLFFVHQGKEHRVKRVIARREAWPPWSDMEDIRLWVGLTDGAGAVLLYQKCLGTVMLERVVADIRKKIAEKRASKTPAVGGIFVFLFAGKHE